MYLLEATQKGARTEPASFICITLLLSPPLRDKEAEIREFK